MMRPFAHKADSGKLAALAKHYPDLVVQEHRKPARGMFMLHFNNRKRQIGGFQSQECEGVLYSDGVVHINTKAFPQREFHTLSEMREAIEEYGDCVIVWFDEVK